MVMLSISLPEELQAFIEKQVAAGIYKDASEYIHFLILQERERLAQQKLETLLIEGLESGEFEVTDKWWEQKRTQLIEKARQQQ